MNFHQPLHCYIVSICCFELSLQSIRYSFRYEWEKPMHNVSNFARYANGYLVSCSLWKQRSSFLLSRFPEFVHTHNTLFDSHRGEISSHFIPHYYTFLGSIRLTSLKLGALKIFHFFQVYAVDGKMNCSCSKSLFRWRRSRRENPISLRRVWVVLVVVIALLLLLQYYGKQQKG